MQVYMTVLVNSQWQINYEIWSSKKVHWQVSLVHVSCVTGFLAGNPKDVDILHITKKISKHDQLQRVIAVSMWVISSVEKWC